VTFSGETITKIDDPEYCLLTSCSLYSDLSALIDWTHHGTGWQKSVIVVLTSFAFCHLVYKVSVTLYTRWARKISFAFFSFFSVAYLAECQFTLNDVMHFVHGVAVLNRIELSKVAYTLAIAHATEIKDTWASRGAQCKSVWSPAARIGLDNHVTQLNRLWKNGTFAGGYSD
jgi:hypothetical protein